MKENPEGGSVLRRAHRWCRWFRVEHVLVVSGLALLPWLVVLAAGLPTAAVVSNWRTVWIGLDTAEAVTLITTGLLAGRGHRLHTLTATAAATLLLVDAWFDTMTAAPGADQVSAAAMALGAELPLAAVCAALAARGQGAAAAHSSYGQTDQPPGGEQPSGRGGHAQQPDSGSRGQSGGKGARRSHSEGPGGRRQQ
ncbi:hypothetical protein ACIQVC_00630 [Streptomyces sp. NPDC101112]|uniref:hypothetical protein n=1 Tax=Streptomyces sp. NPDC101112 TaxID=3366105 RepID=UPI0038087F98